MKYFVYFLMLASLGMIVFSLTLIDFDNPFGYDQSKYGLIAFMISICILIFLFIIQLSTKVKAQYDKVDKG